MGFYFRKSINLTKGVRLNLSKSGVSLSVGKKGARFTIGPNGTRTTFSIPNTGIYYTKNYPYKKSDKKTENERVDESQLQQYQDYIDNITKLYKFSYNPIDWEKLSLSDNQYDDSSELIAQQEYDNIKPNIFMDENDALFVEKKQKAYQNLLAVKKENQEKYQAKNEIIALAKQVVQGDSDSYYQVLANDETAESLKDYFTDIEFCYIDKTTMACSIATDIEKIVPQTKVVKENGVVKEKKMSQSEFNKIGQDYVCSLAIRLARELFALLPINKLVVECVQQDKLILSVIFDKDTIEQTNFDSYPDASDYIANYQHEMSFTQSKGFSEVKSLLEQV